MLLRRRLRAIDVLYSPFYLLHYSSPHFGKLIVPPHSLPRPLQARQVAAAAAGDWAVE